MFAVRLANLKSITIAAIHSVDAYGVGGIIASWEHCGRTTKTDQGCKCTQTDVSAEDWTSASYDDSAWPAAADGGINGADPWGVTQEIDLGARWIWASNLQGTDQAYCRCTEGHLSNGDARGHGQFHIRVDDTSTLYGTYAPRPTGNPLGIPNPVADAALPR